MSEGDFQRRNVGIPAICSIHQRAATAVDLSTAAVHCGETRLLRQWSVGRSTCGRLARCGLHASTASTATAAAAAAAAAATRRDSRATERQNAQRHFGPARGLLGCD